MAAGFYDSPLAHLFGELHRLRLKLRARVVLDRHFGRLPAKADLLDRGFISSDAVDAALDDEEHPELTAGAGTVATHLRAAQEADQHVAEHLARARQIGVRLPLVTLAARFGLSPLGRDILLLAAAAELDGGIRQAIAYLQNDQTRQFPDLELAAALFCDDPRARILARAELAPDAPLFRHGLLVLPREHVLDDLSVLRMPLRAARRVVDHLLGDDAADPLLRAATRLDRCPPGRSPLDFMVLPAPDKERLATLVKRVADTTARQAPPVTLLVGPEGSGKSVIAWAIGQATGLSVLRVNAAQIPRAPELTADGVWSRAVREARLMDALLLIEGVDKLGPDDLAALATAADRDPGLLVILEARTSIALQTRRTVIRGEVTLPGHAERQVLWKTELARRSLPTSLGAGFAAKFRVSGGSIQRALDEALSQTHQAPSPPILPVTAAATASQAAMGHPARTDATSAMKAVELSEAIHQRLADRSDHRLGTLATRVTARGRWDDLIVPDSTKQGLERLVAHFRHRGKIMVDWGFEQMLRTGQGISAMFQGPPGTGKTMAAGIIAQEFDLELFQIDLSRIVSKWLGETEKNLATIFDEAEKANAILLFDEADSLFGKRTDVNSSNDRNANLEVNFLLQKMDHFRGITLLTTNLGKSIDDAFVRRMSFKIEFPEPTARERARLWSALLPPMMEVDEDLDVVDLGKRFEMSGGHIRNAILKAAITAASEGSIVYQHHLVDAGNMEYRAIGKLVREGT